MNPRLLLCALLAASLGSACPARAADRPNILFIAIDDLNDWVGCLGGHPQAHTPNIDRLARRGVLFTNAHCQAPICQPSRTSVLTGTQPFHNGVYDIQQQFRDAPALKDAITLPRYFRQHGYRTIVTGKISHHSPEADDWTERGPNRGSWPKFPWRDRETISGLPPGPTWVFDFGPVDYPGHELPDGTVATWAVNRIEQGLPEPFFLAVGFTATHLPHYPPRTIYDRLPPEQVTLPVAPMDDLEDVPPMGRKFTRYFDLSPISHNEIIRRGLWRKAVAAYLGCVAFVDKCVGRVLDALEKSPQGKNTIVVFWSDHGFHLGEKMHWEKRSLWERSTRVPLIVALPGESRRGTRTHRPVGLIDVYPTLVELGGLPAKAGMDGRSLAPLLRDPGHAWPHAAVSTQMPGNHSVRTEDWRYIRYANGDEELYAHPGDPHELRNLAPGAGYERIKRDLGKWIPQVNAPSGPRLPKGTSEFEFDWTKP